MGLDMRVAMQRLLNDVCENEDVITIWEGREPYSQDVIDAAEKFGLVKVNISSWAPYTHLHITEEGRLFAANPLRQLKVPVSLSSRLVQAIHSMMFRSHLRRQ